MTDKFPFSGFPDHTPSSSSGRPNLGSSSNRPNPKEVKEFHTNDDVDSAKNAHHHTLGDGLNQAASGLKLKQLVDQYGLDMGTIDTRLDGLDTLVADVGARLNVLENLGYFFREGSPTNASTIFNGGTITVVKPISRLHVTGFATCYIAATPNTRSVHLTLTKVPGTIGPTPIGGFYFNETASHKAIPCDKVLTGVAAGTYTVSAIFAGAAVAIDANDFYKFTIREF